MKALTHKNKKWLITLTVLMTTLLAIYFLDYLRKDFLVKNFEVILGSVVALLVATIGHFSNWRLSISDKDFEQKILTQNQAELSDKFETLEIVVDDLNSNLDKLRFQTNIKLESQASLLVLINDTNKRIDSLYLHLVNKLAD